MSYAYRLNWTRAVKTLEGSARLQMKVEMLQLLPEREMLALLQGQLTSMGWKQEGDFQSQTMGALELIFDPKTKTLDVNLKETKKVSAHGNDDAAAQEALKRSAKSAGESLDKAVNLALMKGEAKVRETLQKALRTTYLEALKIKAARMGEVQSVREHVHSDGTQELVIKVKA